MSWLIIKDKIWYIYDFLKVVGNNIRVLFFIFDYIDHATVIACF